MEELKSTVATGALSTAQRYMRHVYNWMAVGLLLTAASAWMVASSPALLSLLFGSTVGVVVLGIAVIALPMVLSGMISRLSSGAATALFIAYSVLMGSFLSPVLLVYTGASVFAAFAVTGGLFGCMSLYGAVTKRDLTSMGSFMFMGLIGIIIASIVNLFLHSAMMDFVLSVICVIVFTGLTAFDTQKLLAFGSGMYGDGTAVRRGALLGALTLDLDFVNLFLAILRLLGDRR